MKKTENSNPKQGQTERLTMYSLTELEPILGVTHRTLLQYVNTGKLPAKKIGGKWRVTAENLEKFVNSD
jgi:excisionase family DNA binding protein